MQTLFCDRPDLRYDGTQLRSHWIYDELGLLGDALVSFVGPAEVTLDHLVDLEDVKKKAPIFSPRMVHFLGEWFEDSLERAILRQQLLCCEMYELLLERGIGDLARRGNDLFFAGRKLSVSIATRSPLSVLVHAAINVDTEGTPVPTAGLRELGVGEEELARAVLERFRADDEGMRRARAKVRPVP